MDTNERIKKALKNAPDAKDINFDDIPRLTDEEILNSEPLHVGKCEGYDILRKPNGVGGYRYFSIELGQTIWDTSITSESTLLFVLSAEKERAFQKRMKKDDN